MVASPPSRCCRGLVERLSLTGRLTAGKIAAFLRGDLDLDRDVEDDSDIPVPPNAPRNEDINCIDPSFAWGDQPTQTPPSEPLPPRVQDREPIRPRGERLPVTEDDVRTIQAKLRSEKYSSLSATQLFLKELKRNKRRHGIAYRIDRGEDGRITRVFWTYQWCINLWKRHPDLLIVDNT